MQYGELYSTVVTVLTAIITGGFILVFVEIGNRKSREIDKYYRIAEPFLGKLSACLRLISWYSDLIIYPQDINENEDKFKSTLEELAKYGSRLIMEGNKYDADSISAQQVSILANKINNIWYFYGKMNSCRLQMNQVILPKRNMEKEVRAISQFYKMENLNIELLSTITGDFYEAYQSIECLLYRHEKDMKIYDRETKFVVGCAFIVLVILCLMVFTVIPEWILKLIIFFAISTLGISLLFLGVDMKRQRCISARFYKFRKNIMNKTEALKPVIAIVFFN